MSICRKHLADYRFPILLILSLTGMCLSGLVFAELTFTNQSESSNLAFPHDNDQPDNSFGMPISMSAGVASGDYDNDGDVDLYVARGSAYSNALLRNNGDGTFTDVAVAAGVDLPNKLDGGPVFGDINGDGWLDLLVGGLAGSGHTVFLNQKDGTFADFTSESGILQEHSEQHDYSISMGDPDQDGDLDVYFGHWGSETGVTHFWMNQGDGTFHSSDQYSGVAEVYAESDASFSPGFADIDGDGRQDLLVASDFDTSHVFRNTGSMHFENITTEVIDDQAGMGSAIGDFDNDGDMDWFVTAIWWSADRPLGGNRLYQNDGSGNFANITEAAGVLDGAWGWGACAADFNNDGWLDLFHVNGMNIPGQDERFLNDLSKLFINQGDGSFQEQALDLGIEDSQMGRGVVCFDSDSDGDIDIFTNSTEGTSQFYRNDLSANPGWLQIKLAGEMNNPSAVATKIALTTGELTQIREVRVGSNYQSQDPLLQHFGLGGVATVDELKITWPHGGETVLTNLEPNQVILLSADNSTPPPFAIRPGITAAWVDPALSKEGFVIEILEGGIAVLYWFTYDMEGNQDWFISVGQIKGRRIFFDQLLSVSGGHFGVDTVPEVVIETPVGRAAFTWTSCDTGFMDWEIGEDMGHLQLVRLTNVLGVSCDDLAGDPPPLANRSGAWIDEDRDAEGYVLEMLSESQAVVFYFGWDADGNRRWLIGVGTIEDGKITISNMLTTSGGRFSDPANDVNASEVPWGTVELDVSCEQGTAAFDSTEEGFGSGVYNLGRLTFIAGLPCS